MASCNPPLHWMYKARETDSEEVKAVVSVATDTISSLDNCLFDVEVLNHDGEDGGTVTREKCPLQIDMNKSTVVFLDKEIHVSNIRYAILHTIESSVGVLISWMNKETLLEEYPVFLYNYILPTLQTQEVREALSIVNAVRYLKYVYMQRCLSVTTDKIEIALDFYTPGLIEQCNGKITRGGSQRIPALQQDKFQVIIDRECISFFKHPYDNQAFMCFFLWDESGAHVLEKVLCVKDEKVIKLISGNQTTMVLPMDNEATERLMSIMNQMSSLKKKGFQDKDPLLRHVRNLLDGKELNKKSKATNRTALVNDSDNIVRELDQAEYECGKLDQELLEDINIRWVVAESEIIQTVSEGLIPETDILSGGFDENNADHFTRCIKHVEELLNEENYEAALSQIQGIKTIFGASDDRGIRVILQNDDIALLRKVFFRIYTYR